MAQYIILKNDSEKLVAIKLGFSWITLFLVWVSAIFEAIGMFSPTGEATLGLVLFTSIILGAIIGIPAGLLWNRAKKLFFLKKGYKQIDVQTAANSSGAMGCD